MAYEGINTSSLKSSLNKLDNIDYKKIDSLSKNINSNDWQSPSRTRVIAALEEIEKEYKKIENNIKKYKEVCSDIDEYKKIEEKISKDQTDLARYKIKLAATSSDDNLTRMTYEIKISSLEANIRTNKSKLNTLKNSINNF